MEAFQEGHRPEHRRMSLCELARRITLGDAWALNEFHENRFPFRAGGKRLRFCEYVEWLGSRARFTRPSARSAGDIVLEEACNLTVDKFLRLPSADCPPAKPGDGAVTGRSFDCRRYFSAYLQTVVRAAETQPAMGQLEEESLAARVLQGLVARQFGLSLKEAWRHANPCVSRYTFKMNGTRMTLWFPRDFSGRKRRPWLAANVEDVDPSRPGEKERVQGIIDRILVKGSLVSMESLPDELATRSTQRAFLPWAVLYGLSAYGMAAIVAQEKADNIEKQRPEIRRLGPAALKELIFCIFEGLEHSRFCAAEIAQRFDLSKSTLSRFAGTKWHTKPDNLQHGRAPDLYVNTAHILSKHQGFVEAAREAGVWPRVQALRQLTPRLQRKEHSHAE